MFPPGQTPSPAMAGLQSASPGFEAPPEPLLPESGGPNLEQVKMLLDGVKGLFERVVSGQIPQDQNTNIQILQTLEQACAMLEPEAYGALDQGTSTELYPGVAQPPEQPFGY